MKDKYSDPWKIYADRYETLYWKPCKPSDDDKKIFHKFVEQALKRSEDKSAASEKERKRALVLGATPAIRDVLSQSDVDVTLLYINNEMVHAMNKLITHKKKETIISGNWLDMPFPDNYFDIVIDDLALGNIDEKNEQEFLGEISRVLKPSGCWIFRIFFVPDGFVKLLQEQILKQFEIRDDTYNRDCELFIHFVYNVFDIKKKISDTSLVKKSLTKYWKDGAYHYPDKKVEQWMNDMYKMWSPFEKMWRVSVKKELYSWVSKKFKIIKEEPATDYIWGHSFPVLMCRPKK